MLAARDSPALAPDELRLLWCEDDDAAMPRRERVDRLLRLALSPLVGVAPEHLRFGREAKGRPFLRHPGAPDFNLSDTGGGSLLAITLSGRVGVDLERTDRVPPVLRLARRWFAADEFAALEALPEAEQPLAFLQLWTAKEASCKATGTGIFGFLPQWHFRVDSSEPVLLGLPSDAGASERWRFLRRSPAAGFTAVIALRDAADIRVRGFRFRLD